MPQASASFLPKIAFLGIGYVAIAWAAVKYIQQKPFLSIFEAETSAARQIIFGALTGVVLGLIQAAWLRYWAWWRDLQIELAGANPGLFRAPVLTVLLISVIVGITEEILFRAAIQPVVGIWLASVLFTVGHMNFDFSGFKKSDLPFALLSIGTVFAVSLAMGVLFERFGLLASIAAHIFYDAIVLLAYRNLLSQPVKSNSE